ncbi:hypothetical protein [Acidisphaera sp. S103]|uniref:hypothetical protein n=1 Tax=Acidisphaera sp. S103 TaxID=1747223 RepID=UPI0020B148AB|nr:hypothetical protein [Acidisphaera sp. S103]
MSARSAAAIAVQEVPKGGTGFLLAVAAAIVCQFDCVLAGMIRTGLGVEATCAYLGLTRAVLDYNLVRLDLLTPHNRPRRKGGRRAWTDDELRCAIYWRCLGIHPESIGLAFGRSAPAVRSKLHRLGVPAPDRKKLHKVDAAALDRTLPDFGFPVPPDDRDDPAVTTPPADIRHNHLAIVPATIDDSSPASAATATPASAATATRQGTRKHRNVDVPGQRDLTLPSVTPVDEPEPTASSEVITAEAKADKTPEKSVAICTASDDREKPLVLGSAELIEQYRVAGKVRHPATNEPFLRWLTLLYLGGLHTKAIAAYLGLTPPAVYGIMYRMQMPHDMNRSHFGWTCDLECAVAQMEQWTFEFFRCRANAGLSEDMRPLFWRRKGDGGNRKRRCFRLKNNELDDYSKYKGGLTVEIMTRAELEAQRRVSNSGTDHLPVRLHAPMQGSLPIQQGAANEQYASRGHAPAVRSGLSRDAREQMPWTYARNGRTARPVTHP